MKYQEVIDGIHEVMNREIPWLLSLAEEHICHLIHSVDESKLNNYWLDYEGYRVTLDAMIRGYIRHLNLLFGQMHELV